jgi:hypothetical protein
VQVGTADIGSGDSDDGVGRTFDFGIQNVVNRDLTTTAIHNGFHIVLPIVNCKKPEPRRTYGG